MSFIFHSVIDNQYRSPSYGSMVRESGYSKNEKKILKKECITKEEVKKPSEVFQEEFYRTMFSMSIIFMAILAFGVFMAFLDRRKKMKNGGEQ